MPDLLTLHHFATFPRLCSTISIESVQAKWCAIAVLYLSLTPPKISSCSLSSASKGLFHSPSEQADVNCKQEQSQKLPQCCTAPFFWEALLVVSLLSLNRWVKIFYQAFNDIWGS